MKNLIEVVHSSYGMMKLEVRKECKRVDHCHNGNKLKAPFDFTEVCFYYPSGNYMGSWDEERGGCLGHPSETAEQAMRMVSDYWDRDNSLLDVDPNGYAELEDLLEKEVNRFFPDFLKK
jgi:hypothetical protein